MSKFCPLPTRNQITATKFRGRIEDIIELTRIRRNVNIEGRSVGDCFGLPYQDSSECYMLSASVKGIEYSRGCLAETEAVETGPLISCYHGNPASLCPLETPAWARIFSDTLILSSIPQCLVLITIRYTDWPI